MSLSTRASFAVAAALLAASVCAAPAKAAQESFPTRPMRYIVPNPPAGASALVARIVAAALCDAFRQQLLYDTRAGAAGTPPPAPHCTPLGPGAGGRNPPDGGAPAPPTPQISPG